MLRLDALLKNMPIKVFEPGEIIFQKGEHTDNAYIVLNGTVIVHAFDKSGVERRILSTQRYEMMPSSWLADPDTTIAYNYRAMDRVVCVVIDKIHFQDKLIKNPLAMFDLLLVQDQRMQFAKNRIEMLVQPRAEDKMLYMMRYLSQRLGKVSNDLDWLDVESNLTQSMLADSLGLTRETGARAIKNLEKRGIIRVGAKRHYQVNIQKMRKATE